MLQQFDFVMVAAKEGKEVDLSDMPGPPPEIKPIQTQSPATSKPVKTTPLPPNEPQAPPIAVNPPTSSESSYMDPVICDGKTFSFLSYFALLCFVVV